VQLLLRQNFKFFPCSFFFVKISSSSRTTFELKLEKKPSSSRAASSLSDHFCSPSKVREKPFACCFLAVGKKKNYGKNGKALCLVRSCCG
jgi:hypothetical protein